jgi:hypothetical protein
MLELACYNTLKIHYPTLSTLALIQLAKEQARRIVLKRSLSKLGK